MPLFAAPFPTLLFIAVVPFFMVGIAQLVRAPDCGSGGRRFESVYPPHFSSWSKNGQREYPLCLAVIFTNLLF